MEKIIKAMGKWLPIELQDWINFLPPTEKQRKFGLDTLSCVTQALVNLFEAIFNYAYKKGFIKNEALEFLRDNDYFKDGYIQFSKRAIAELSNTTKSGNTGEDVFKTILEFGLHPEKMHPWIDEDEWKEYYEETPQNVINVGKEFKNHFGLGGGWIAENRFKEHLKKSPIAGSVFAWLQDNKKYGKLYYKPDRVNRNHFVLLYKILPTGNQRIRDSYDPFLKTLHESNHLKSGIYGKIYIKNNSKLMNEEIKKLLKENDQGTIVNSDTQETGYVLRETVITTPTVEEKVDMLIDMKNRGVLTKSAEYVDGDTWEKLPKMTLEEFQKL